MTVTDTLTRLGIVLPAPAAAIASYVPFVRSGNLLVISGQLPLLDGKLVASGHLGKTVSIEEGQRAARQSAVNLLAQANAALGALDKIVRVVRLGGFISCTAEFVDHAKVMNGASDVMESVFGEAGRHARTTIGVPSLPLGAAVEVEGLFEVA
jgi:enamine deaminase RidA (YjgF/YER057c/UK114 family)